MSDLPAPAPPLDSQALLNLIFDHSGEGICIFDAQLRLMAFNDRFVELTGLPIRLLQVGVHVAELLRAQALAGEFGPVDVEATVAEHLAIILSKPVHVSERLRGDGRTIELRRSRTPGGGFITMSSDVTERKATQDALADEQRMLQVLIRHTEQGIWFIDNEVRTTNANPAMCRLLGRSLADMVGRSIFDFVDAANAEIFRHNVALRAQGRATSYAIGLLHADGHVVHCLNNATPHFDAQGNKVGAVGMFTDVSQLLQAQEQVRLTGELLAQKTSVLEMTLNSLTQGVASFDAQGRNTAYNRPFLELLELPESLMGNKPTIDDLLRYQHAHGLAHEDHDAPEARARRSAQRYQRTRRDGMVIEVQVYPGGDGSLVRTYTDVTVAVAAQRTLQESEARFRSMADAAPAYIWQCDAEGLPIWFNQRWLQTTGRTLAQELTVEWSHRMHLADIERAANAFYQALARQDAFQLEYRVGLPDGRLLWLADHGAPRLSPAGEFEGYTMYGWDITERKAGQDAVLAAKEEAERANRAKSEFLSRMSHELRTPLNAVLGFAQLMEADLVDPLTQGQRVRIQDLQRGGRHLLGLINDVLDIARIEAGTLHLELVPVELNALAQECFSLVGTFAASCQIELLLPPQPPCWVLADPMRLRQVLLNLLSNAIKYNREAGQVKLSWQQQGTITRMAVQDTGPGLSPEQQAKLFRAFERLQVQGSGVEGTGIGLALSKWLVELMRGHIGVSSAVGQGSEFWLTLEAAQAPPTTTPQAEMPKAVAPFAVHTPAQAVCSVLYIEDNEVNQMLMQGMLSMRPHIELRIASRPEVGLAMAAEAPPALILLDIQLPGFDGYEVLHRWREHEATHGLPAVPVLAVSANATKADRQRAESAGFADYITKPIDLSHFLAVIDRYLAD
jgi:PAS domain S-box-containing protein